MKTEYHGHPNYFAVWLALLVFLALSLAVGAMGHGTLAIGMIFLLAIVKAAIVLGNFMHLRWEPRFFWGVLAFAVLCLAFLYFGVMPDIVGVEQRLAK